MNRWRCGALVLLCACGKPQFPEKFLWGASIAGFQVDMGCPTLSSAQCNDPNSDWFQLVTEPALLSDLSDKVSGEPLSHAPGYWELFDQDHARAKKDLGLKSLRLSIEWSRVFPTATDGADGYDALKALADPQALAKYHAIFASLKANGLKPLVTLNHYTLPLWIHDGLHCHQNLDTCTNRGWLDGDRTVREIAKYAGFAAQEFGGEVDLWATENEPFAVILPGYVLPNTDRVNPPAVQLRFAEAKQAMVAMIEAHARMYDAIKAHDTVDADGDGQASQVGLVYSMVPVRPQTPGDPLDENGAKNVFYLLNTAFLDGVCKGDLDADLTGRPTHRDDLAHRMDYVGINYYTPTTVKGASEAQLADLSPLTTFDITSFEVKYVDDPHGLYEMAMHVKDRYGLPSIITENGTANTSDAEAPTSWVVRHATWLSRAITDGADVRGYFYWTLMDNYEWNHGMSSKFGLYAVDPMDAEKTRVARPLVGNYARIIKENGVPKDLADKYPAPAQ